MSTTINTTTEIRPFSVELSQEQMRRLALEQRKQSPRPASGELRGGAFA